MGKPRTELGVEAEYFTMTIFIIPSPFFTSFESMFICYFSFFWRIFIIHGYKTVFIYDYFKPVFKVHYFTSIPKTKDSFLQAVNLLNIYLVKPTNHVYKINKLKYAEIFLITSNRKTTILVKSPWEINVH